MEWKQSQIITNPSPKPDKQEAATSIISKRWRLVCDYDTNLPTSLNQWKRS